MTVRRKCLRGAVAATFVTSASALTWCPDQLEEIVADESLGLIDHYRCPRSALQRV